MGGVMFDLHWIADGVGLLRLQRAMVRAWLTDEVTVRRGWARITVEFGWTRTRLTTQEAWFSDDFATSIAYRMLLGYRVEDV